MWGLDCHGLRVLSAEEVSDLVTAGCFIEQPREFTFAELFKAAWPYTGKKDKEGKPVETSLNQLRQLAKQGALKWGPYKLEPEELTEPQETNQEFCVISWGKKRKEMIFFS